MEGHQRKDRYKNTYWQYFSRVTIKPTYPAPRKATVNTIRMLIDKDTLPFCKNVRSNEVVLIIEARQYTTDTADTKLRSSGR